MSGEFAQHRRQGRVIQRIRRVQEHQVPAGRLRCALQEGLHLGPVDGHCLAAQHAINQVRIALAHGTGLAIEFHEVNGLSAPAAALHAQ